MDLGIAGAHDACRAALKMERTPRSPETARCRSCRHRHIYRQWTRRRALWRQGRHGYGNGISPRRAPRAVSEKRKPQDRNSARTGTIEKSLPFAYAALKRSVDRQFLLHFVTIRSWSAGRLGDETAPGSRSRECGGDRHATAPFFAESGRTLAGLRTVVCGA